MTHSNIVVLFMPKKNECALSKDGSFFDDYGLVTTKVTVIILLIDLLRRLRHENSVIVIHSRIVQTQVGSFLYSL